MVPLHLVFCYMGTWASQVVQWYRIHLPMQEMQVRSLGQKDPLEREMATHSSTLAWKIPWTEEPGGLQSLVLQSWTHIYIHTHTYRHLRLCSLLIRECGQMCVCSKSWWSQLGWAKNYGHLFPISYLYTSSHPQPPSSYDLCCVL